MSQANASRFSSIAPVMGIAACIAGAWLLNLRAAQRNLVGFDDAYMFARYAANLRHGHGFSWDPDGLHTYGPTSLLWTLLVTLLSALPIKSWVMLTTASWLCSVGAVFATAWAVARNAHSHLLSTVWRTLPFVVVPMVDASAFFGNQATGMETMLAMLLAAVFAGLALRWAQGRESSLALGLCGLLLFLARPEAGLVVIALPVLLFVLRPLQETETTRVSLRSLALALGVFAAGVAAELLLCRAYFGTPLPLSFYMKGHDAYQGYAEVWYPELQLLAFLACCQIFLAAIVLFARRRDVRLLLCFFVPLALLFGYLQTVTQIMGFHARYYIPYLPLVIVSSLLLLDRSLAQNYFARRMRSPRIAVAAALLGLLLATQSESVLAHIRRAEGRVHTEYAPVTFTTAATTPLPEQDWARAMLSITDDLAAKLPAGTTIAATEVGYLSAEAPQVHIIDLAGLNDTSIARNGFSPDALLDRKPDLIWLPNSSYTWQRGVLLTSPRMLAEYDIYPGAAKFGIALRKSSPFHTALERQLDAYWQKNYPGTDRSAYRATGVHWSSQPIQVKAQ